MPAERADAMASWMWPCASRNAASIASPSSCPKLASTSTSTRASSSLIPRSFPFRPRGNRSFCATGERSRCVALLVGGVLLALDPVRRDVGPDRRRRGGYRGRRRGDGRRAGPPWGGSAPAGGARAVQAQRHRAADRARRLRRGDIRARGVSGPPARGPRPLPRPRLRRGPEDDAAGRRPPGLDGAARRVQPERVRRRHRPGRERRARPRPRAVAALRGAGVNDFLLAATAMLAGFIPVGIVCLRGGPIDALAALELAG